jgi:hydrogenase-4 component B
VIGLALALLGKSLQQPVWVLLGLAGCLLHVWNHALFKSLLFLSAGSVIHARHTREIDHLGGLSKLMPATSTAFLIGAAAICGLPPLNGFISEFLIYSGLFDTLGLKKGAPAFPAAAFAIPALALMGALAVACFVKVFGVVFLGSSRTPPEPGHPPQESPWTMLAPLGVLAACCLAIGLAPTFFAPLIERAIAVWTNEPVATGTLALNASLVKVSQAAVLLLAALGIGMLLLEWRFSTLPLAWSETWGCGYAAPTPRMQYTASSLAQFLVTLFGWSLQPKVRQPRLTELFPKSARFMSHVPEVVLDRCVLPACAFLGRTLLWIRLMQQGSVHIYLVYIFAILVFLLLFWR